MKSDFFLHPLLKLHYYQFGHGAKPMLCFHGFGMHGKQFLCMEKYFGRDYTFYGFDLLFHKQTKLNNQTLSEIKKPISKEDLAQIFIDFCDHQGIEKFAILSYSMGTYYAGTLVECFPDRISELLMSAPSTFESGQLVLFFSRNKLGNKIFEKLMLSNHALLSLIKLIKKLSVIDEKEYEILCAELSTLELRFAFYACLTYLRAQKLDNEKFIEHINQHQIQSIFVFGKRDQSYPKKIGEKIIPQLKNAVEIVIDENHDMINDNFAHALWRLMYDNKT
ncbi:MAG: alpha/beta hydrolase [Sphingobacteriales bacterium]|nr:alpha/beta hydrolase [Sphingobacteriales bacterium]